MELDVFYEVRKPAIVVLFVLFGGEALDKDGDCRVWFSLIPTEFQRSQRGITGWGRL